MISTIISNPIPQPTKQLQKPEPDQDRIDAIANYLIDLVLENPTKYGLKLPPKQPNLDASSK